jgi:mono/diheme cytochrome c family protein
MRNRSSIICALAWLSQPLALLAAEPTSANLAKLPPPATRPVDYAQDIKPLLAKYCYECHGADAQEAGLRLDRKKSALAGADSGPVFVDGKSATSRLIHLVAGLDEEVGRMPPEDSGDALTAEQIGLLRAWIDQGLQWPDDGKGDVNTAAAKLWSLQPIVRPKAPTADTTKWIRNPIDAFILAKLEKESVTPSPEADRLTLIRRVYLDLLGLPPNEAEIQSYVNSQQPDAYEQMVDRALESPHYGERWGRYWLDAARYADTDGFEEDRGRPFAWRYRDWVIDALNRDVPFDVFTVQQLAGDLLAPTDSEYDKGTRIATGFQRNTMLNLEGGADREEDRVKRTIDRTNTMGTVWLGLTVGCANCHTHKYDPITQREYFQLYAFYNSLDEVDIAVNQAEGSDEAPDLTPRQQMMDVEDDKSEPEIKPEPAPKAKKEKAPKVEAEVARRMAGTMTLAQAVREIEKPRVTHVHLRGDFLSPGPEVQANTLEVLPPLTARGKNPDRLDLARWLVDKRNPLTARVTANRIWQNHFGRGLVFTSDDFGTQGEPPSHSELLDWLAAELQDGGWRLKRLHRLIVTSATYRQSAVARPELVERDPYNTWLARQNRIRMEAEIVRDLALSASGQLDRTVGGPSVRPPQPFGLFDVAYAGPTGFAKWEVSKGSDRYRRGMYIWFQRISPYPSLMAFDSPEMNLTCTRRERSNTPLQSLTLLNDVVFVECAQALGRRMMTECQPDHKSTAADDRIAFAFRTCLGRLPTDSERKSLGQLYARMLERFQNDPAAATKLIGDSPPEKVNPGQLAACVAVARALVNLDEFITRE